MLQFHLKCLGNQNVTTQKRYSILLWMEWDISNTVVYFILYMEWCMCQNLHCKGRIGGNLCMSNGCSLVSLEYINVSTQNSFHNASIADGIGIHSNIIYTLHLFKRYGYEQHPCKSYQISFRQPERNSVYTYRHNV